MQNHILYYIFSLITIYENIHGVTAEKKVRSRRISTSRYTAQLMSWSIITSSEELLLACVRENIKTMPAYFSMECILTNLTTVVFQLVSKVVPTMRCHLQAVHASQWRAVALFKDSVVHFHASFWNSFLGYRNIDKERYILSVNPWYPVSAQTRTALLASEEIWLAMFAGADDESIHLMMISQKREKVQAFRAKVQITPYASQPSNITIEKAGLR